MKKLNLLLFILLLSLNFPGAQTLDFQTSLGDSNTADWAYDIVRTYSGAYVMTGITGGLGFGQEDLLLLKTDSLGNKIWSRRYGNTGQSNFARAIVQTSDSGFAVAGQTENTSGNSVDLWLFRFDKKGDSLWQKTYGFNQADEAYSLVQTPDDGFLLTGNALINSKHEIYLVKTDAFGDTLWTRLFSAQDELFATDLLMHSSGYFYICGYSRGNNSDFLDVLLLKISPAGNLVWMKTFDGPASGTNSGDFATSLIETNDGGIAISGTEGFIQATGFTGQALILKTDSAGVQQWKGTFDGGNISSQAEGIIQRKDSGFVLLANRDSSQQGTDVSVIRLDASGQQIWRKDFDAGSTTDKGLSLIKKNENSYVLAGYTYQQSHWYQVLLAQISEAIITERHKKWTFPEISVYPMPANDYLQVDFDGNIERLEFYDIQGRHLKSSDGRNAYVGDLTEGVYLLQIHTQNQAKITQKVLIHR